MTLSHMSVKRPIAMCCFIIMLVLLGGNAYRKIGIDLLPKFDIPYVQITTVYPGASPEELEVEVAKRIEDVISGLDGVKHITSTCMENVCATTIEFQLGTNVDLAIHEVREKLNTIVEDFPDSVETPKLSKVNINAIPVVTLYLTGDRTLDDLYDYVDDQLSDQFSSIPGVGEVRIHGGNEMQLHVILNHEKIAAANLKLSDIVNTIKNSNKKMPAGRIKDKGQEISITYDAEFHSLDELRQQEIGKQSGKRVYLGDIAEISLISKEIRQEAFLNNQIGVAIEIVKKSDANAVKVIDAIHKKFDLLQKSGQIPRGMSLHWFKDSGEFIIASVDDAWSSITMGIILTAILLFLFLHELRSTFIIAVTMPVSVVVTFAAMKMMNYTFDMMTLISLGCSSGVLVTNSVVVIENIFKKISTGSELHAAAADGTAEVINAVAASALTNVVVFVPVAMMSSVVGLLFSPFAGVMVIATLVSLFVSFTLTPILAAILLTEKARTPGKINKAIFHWWDIGYDWLCRVFNKSMVWTAKAPGTIIVMTILLCVLICAVSLPNISLSFVPDNDRSEYSISLEFPSNSNLSESKKRTREIMEAIAKEPFVTKLGATVGYKNAMPGQVSEGVHLAEITVLTKPKGERPAMDDMLEITRRKLSKFNNLQYSMAIPKPTGQSGAEFSACIIGPDFPILEKYAKIGMRLLEESGKAKDIDTSIRVGKPRINLIPRRPIFKNLGLEAASVGTSIVGFFEGVEAGTYKIGSRSFDIRVKMEERQGIDQVGKLTAGSIQDKPINLDVLTEIQPDNVSISLIRKDKERSAWLYANPAPGFVTGDIVNLLNTKLVPQLPPGYRLLISGQAEMMEDGAKDFVEAFIIAIALTYLLIALIMESWARPFLVMFTVPLGFVGMFLSIYLAHTSLSMVGLLGGIMMLGIVVNNAILIMDECATLENNGITTHKAMLTAVEEKFRPIIMTSIASVAGILPMAFGTGLGSEIRASCGIGVVGGLLFSAVTTLYLIPALYFKFVRDTALPKPTFRQRVLDFFRVRPRVKEVK